MDRDHTRRQLYSIYRCSSTIESEESGDYLCYHGSREQASRAMVAGSIGSGPRLASHCRLGREDIALSMVRPAVTEPGIRSIVCRTHPSKLYRRRCYFPRPLPPDAHCDGEIPEGGFPLGRSYDHRGPHSFPTATRYGSMDVNPLSAAWTGTTQTFMQLPVSAGAQSERIRREDECRLAYLASEEHQDMVPMSPWKPFGTTALKDVELKVQIHVKCKGHGLHYQS